MLHKADFIRLCRFCIYLFTLEPISYTARCWVSPACLFIDKLWGESHNSSRQAEVQNVIIVLLIYFCSSVVWEAVYPWILAESCMRARSSGDNFIGEPKTGSHHHGNTHVSPSVSYLIKGVSSGRYPRLSSSMGLLLFVHPRQGPPSSVTTLRTRILGHPPSKKLTIPHAQSCGVTIFVHAVYVKNM